MIEAISRYCADIGRDPLLVQGGGGNVSWKDGGALWIKASGTWLSEALDKQIFVPVDLAAIGQALAAENYSYSAAPLDASGLRPSIETLLHAVMPQRVVVHIHAVGPLSVLVRRAWKKQLDSRLAALPGLKWTSVPYVKPGADLAKAAADALRAQPDAEVVFLGSHGIIIGAEDAAGVDRLLRQLLTVLDDAPRASAPGAAALPAALPAGFVPLGDVRIDQLARDPQLFERLEADWALYPDHVVFLGARPIRVDTIEQMASWTQAPADFVFVRGAGVAVQPGFSLARRLQLACYYEVLARQPREEELNRLSDAQVADLLGWDAEKHRIAISR